MWRACASAGWSRGGGPLRWRIRIEPDAAEHGAQWPAWGYGKIAAIAAADGCDVGSASSVERAMARRDLLRPVRYQPERRQLAAARREVFSDPPVRRNRVWQADLTSFETAAEGIWRLCPVVDHATEAALGCPITPTQGATDLIAALQSAVDAAEALLGRPVTQDCTDPATGEIHPLVIVTDNGPAMKSVAKARRFAARSHLAHVWTQHRSPHTNGVAERWTEPLKHERPYRYDIASGIELADHVTAFTDEYNTARPHQTLHQTPPQTAYPNDRTLKPNPPETSRILNPGQLGHLASLDAPMCVKWGFG